MRHHLRDLKTEFEATDGLSKNYVHQGGRFIVMLYFNHYLCSLFIEFYANLPIMYYICE